MTAAPGATATLVLAGSAPTPEEPVSAATPLLGLPLLRRTALAARRVGFDRVYVLESEPALSGAVLEATGAVVVAASTAPPPLAPGRIVVLPDRCVASVPWLRSLREAPLEPGRLHRLGAGALVETTQTAPLSTALERERNLADILTSWSATLPPGAPPPGIAPPFTLTSPAQRAAAETLLLKTLVKKEDGMIASRVNRRVSLAVTRRLASTPVTPNIMTFVCLGLGLAAAWCFLSPALSRQIAGGALFLLHSILDGCDGELARLKFQESRLGGLFDFWADNLVHVAVFAALAVAWNAANGQAWPFALGALAVSGTALSAGFLYTSAMRHKRESGPLLTTVSPARRSRLSQILDESARRDFIYLVMLLALFGKAYWFVAAAAVGTPAFFLSLVVVALGGRRLGGAGGSRVDPTTASPG